MSSYAAFIGHQPHISLAELSAVIPDFTLKRIINAKQTGSRSVVLFESAVQLEQKSLSMLGGTVSIARRLSEASLSIDDVPQLLTTEVLPLKGKIVFAIRALGLPSGKVRDLYRQCKQRLKKQGRLSRYVGSDKVPAPTALLLGEGMVEGAQKAVHGCEIVLIQGKEDEDLWIGKTVAAQDIDAYSKRDMKKPVRDTTVGLLPPKLAQVLLNFGEWLVMSDKRKAESGEKKANRSPLTTPRLPLVVLDPFCGTGVIPMEALLRGWTVLASDASLKAVNGCAKNLDWLRKEEGILKKDVPSLVWKQDARKPFDLKEKPDMIVTETTLGPSLTKRMPLKDLQKMKKENEDLQRAFLENMAACFPGVPVVCTWPVWYGSKGQERLEKVMETAHKLGYQAILPPGIESDMADRTSLVYRRPDQFVGREIVMLRARA